MLQIQSKNLVVIDLETSGVNPFRHDVLAIGLAPVSIRSAERVIYVRSPQICWSPYAKKNFEKFSADWEIEAIEPIAACEELERYFLQIFDGEPAVAIGHNVGFDVAFLRKLAFLAAKDEIVGLSHRALDTHTILHLLFLKGAIPASAVKSDGAFEYFGIDIPEKQRHTALGDAIATRKLFFKLLEALGISGSATI
ncbi:exonuclease domain-containing protein [Collimonas fungivorans]|uniref:3'-5' exonuclease n=1 Tax=Collimonas fungivorans TaxID=158899 RepID=UPI00167F7B4F|nr:exonuclease domain-containing protein [Collimonas fungivorans]